MMTKGPIQGNYKAGDVVEMQWHVWADHGGWYSYRICLDGSDTEECFRQNILSNTNGEQQMTVTHGSTDTYVAQMKIPDINCDHCTLSWLWHGDPSYEDNIFVNCIDISISGGAPSPTPTPPTPPPSPTPTPSPVPTPTPPPPTPWPDMCTTMDGQDCSGGDIAESLASSASACCDWCGQTSGCAAWTWSQYDGQGQQNPTCYLKSSCDTQQDCGTCTAGKVNPAPPAPPSPAPTPVPPPPAPTPVPSACPGGGLGPCIELCPSDIYETCVQECVRRCGDSFSLQV